jgi:hypothetical protein
VDGHLHTKLSSSLQSGHGRLGGLVNRHRHVNSAVCQALFVSIASTLANCKMEV